MRLELWVQRTRAEADPPHMSLEHNIDRARWRHVFLVTDMINGRSKHLRTIIRTTVRTTIRSIIRMTIRAILRVTPETNKVRAKGYEKKKKKKKNFQQEYSCCCLNLLTVNESS